MAMTHEEAVSKVAKLLRLAQSDNPNEAALAAARAQEIMDRYKLEGITADFDAGGKAEPDEPININEPLDPVQNSTWSQRLAVALASANQCRIYIGLAAVNGTFARRPFIVGRPSDVEAVRYLYNWLKAEVNRLAARDGRGFSAIWKNNFRLGAVDTITRKIRESQAAMRQAMKAEAVADTKNPNALMRVETGLARLEKRSADLDKWIAANMHLKGSARGGHGQSDFGARHAGQKAGEEIDISRKTRLGAAKKQLKE